MITDAPSTHMPPLDARRGRGPIVIVWLFAGVVVLILLLASCSLYLMAAGRAYVAGEGMWSKAQKQAVLALTRYALEHDAEDWHRYEQSLTVVMGDRQARLELEKPQPDLGRVTEGFLAGRNHPEDIGGMVTLFRTFHQMPDIDRAIAIWAEADGQIDRLVALGNEIRAAVEGGGVSPEATRAFLRRLDESDQVLTPLEDAFSQSLGEAARKSHTLLQGLLLALVTVLLAVAYWISNRLVGQNARFQRALQDSEAQLRRLLKFAPLPILIVRRVDGALVYCNDRAVSRLQMSTERLAPYRAQDFYVRVEDRDQVLDGMRRNGEVKEHELELKDTEGQRFWVLLSAQSIVFEGEDCVLSALTDIDQRRRQQQEWHHRAFHDELTGLPNRAMFMDALGRTRHRVERRRGVFYILFVDLDGFKLVNDSHGHRVGDLLLREVALRLRLCVREGDLMARLGGDEFVVLVEADDTLGDITVVARKILATLSPPCLIEDQTLRVTASIGIARYPHDGTELAELMRHADSAMYEAKAAGRNTFRLKGTQA